MMTDKPIWDSSQENSERYRAKKSIGMYIGAGSIFEINEHRSPMGIRPAHCTVHLLGSTMKLYITETHFNAIKKDLEKL